LAVPLIGTSATVTAALPRRVMGHFRSIGMPDEGGFTRFGAVIF
jgi:hypothetical protein